MSAADLPPSLAIRNLNPTKDEEGVKHICQSTVPPSLQSRAALSIASFIWAVPYIHLVPDSCFILSAPSSEGGDEEPVGYVLGVPDTAKFVKSYRDVYIPLLTQRYGFTKPSDQELSVGKSWDTDLQGALLQILFKPGDMLHPEHPSLLEGFPGHLHIDILGPYQHKGYGRLLIERVCNELKTRGCKGVHLVVASDNTHVESFYAKVGFQRWGEVADGGESGELGRLRDKCIVLVRKL